MSYSMKTLLALAAAVLLMPAAHAQESASKNKQAPETRKALGEQERAELETRLHAARDELEAAARKVAELSGQLTGPIAHDYFIAGTGRRGAMLGIGIGDAGTDQSGKDKDADDKGGVVVQNVMPDGPAGKAGLKSGDVIVSLNGASLKDGDKSPSRTLRSRMRSVKPGEKIKLEYLRDGKKHTAEVTAEEMDFGWAAFGRPYDRLFSYRIPPPPGAPLAVPDAPDAPGVPAAGVFFNRFIGPHMLDMELVTLTPKLGQYFGAERGVLVVRAAGDSTLKLEEGDVIVDIDGRQPQSGVHAMRILRSYQPGEKVNINVLRNRRSVKLAVTMPEGDVEQGFGPDRHDSDAPRIKPKPRTFKIPTPPQRDQST